MSTIIYEVNVNSNNVMDYVVEGEIVRTHGDSISEATITLNRSVTTLVTPTEGQTITIKRGVSPNTDTYFLFNGMIVSVKKNYGQYKIKCKDQLYTLVKREINYSYDAAIDASAGVVTSIIEDMIETHGGMTADIITASGSTNTITRFVCKHTDIYEKITELLETIDYQMRYDNDNSKVRVEPKGNVTSSTILYYGVSGQTTNVVGTPEWDYNLSRLMNHIIVEGATSEVETTETFNGDASTTRFDLNHIPISVKVYVDSALQTGGIEGSTRTYDYTVDRLKDDPGVDFTTASTPGVGASNVEVRYSYNVPTPIDVKDDDSISDYGQADATVYLPNAEDVDDAIEQGTALLNKYKTPFVSCRVKLASSIVGLSPGEKIRIDDDLNSEDRTIVISRIKYKIPYEPDELMLGDEAYRLEEWGRNVEKKIKRLNEIYTGDQDILNTVVATNLKIVLKHTSTTIYTQKIYDSFILGHPINGQLGMGTYISDYELEADCTAWTGDGTYGMDGIRGFSVSRTSTADFDRGTHTTNIITANNEVKIG